MGNLKEENLIALQTPLKYGQRVIRIGNSIIPVGVGGINAPGAGSDSSSVAVADVTLGVVDQNGFFQPLRFEGTQASNSGSAIEVLQYKSWNSTLPAPVVGNSMSFYRCASVDTSTQTWTGYLYDVTNQALSAAVTNLTYTSAVAPVVGSYYSEDGVLEISPFSQDKLVFYAPLNTASSSAATGQSFTINGNSIVYGTVDGVPCATFDGSSYIQFSDETLPVLKNDVTYSCFMKATNPIRTNDTVCCYGLNSEGKQFRLLALGQNTAGGVDFAGDAAYLSDIEVSGWKHLAFVCSNGQPFLYLNGEIIAPDYNVLWSSVSTQLNGVATIGTEIRNGSSTWPFIGSMAELKMWKRALSQAEITAEYTRLQNLVSSAS